MFSKFYSALNFCNEPIVNDVAHAQITTENGTLFQIAKKCSKLPPGPGIDRFKSQALEGDIEGDTHAVAVD